jgi:hypothetical protein
MREVTTEPKKYLALDTDWLTAAVAASGLVVCFLLSAHDVWQAFTNAPVAPSVSWHTVMVLLASIWLVTTNESRVLRLGFVLMILASASRLAMYLIHASMAAQMMNSQVMRVIDAIAFITFLVYLVQWFKIKIRHV